MKFLDRLIRIIEMYEDGEEVADRVRRLTARELHKIETLFTVSSALSLKKSDILGEDRKHDLVDARVIITVILRSEVHTYQEIAELLHKDHSTIIWYYKEFQDRLRHKQDFREKYLRCRMYAGINKKNIE